MATILGIDLGSYSVKVARIEQGFRTVHLASIEEERVPEPGEGHPLPPPRRKHESSMNTETNQAEEPAVIDSLVDALLDRQMRALLSILGRQKIRAESCAIGISDDLTLRLVEMPLSDPKKVAQTLPFELAGQLMDDLEGQVVDQLLAEVPTSSSASLWLAASAKQSAVESRIMSMSPLGLDPKLCGSTALATAALWVQSRPGQSPQKELPLWVIDLGHRSTHVCALAAHPKRPGQVLVQFARTIPRGGLHITEAIAKHISIGLIAAEKLKHDNGLSDFTNPRVAKVIREALRPLLRDLRQTLAAYASRFGNDPKALYVTGGTAQLHGIQDLLAEELGIAVQPLLPPDGATWLGPAVRGELPAGESLTFGEGGASRTYVSSTALVHRWPTGTAAVGLGLGAAYGGPNFNFRKGELAFRTDYAMLREKAPLLAGFAVALVVCVGMWAYASLRQLEKESERLRLQLITESTALFGEARSDGRQVSNELQAALTQDKAQGQSIPQVSVLDLLDDISSAAPASNAAGPAHLDVIELHIRPKKTDLKATCGSAQYVDDLAANLAKIPCFRKVQKGKVLTLKNTGPDGKPLEVKQFSLEMETTCP
ncbi:MAG: pilus assembly protein PilM [Deltaproteobacteria bacterium]|jgi:Tfp pilus assembly PilM family ATPase|nr:pilus assembly protein PilM [Deltaproteobacteria bacterium]